MSLIHENSELVHPSDLELFTVAPTDITVQEMEEVPYRPVADFAAGGDMRFEVPGNTDEYIKPSLTVMTFGLQILKENGQPLDQNERVGPVNSTGHSVFSSVTVTLGNQVISSDPAYAHRSDIQTKLSYGADAKESHLTNALYFKDTAGQMDQYVNANAEAGNLGLNKRASYFTRSKIVQCRIHPNSDFFNVDKMIPNQVSLKVSFTRSKPEFCLMAEGTPEVQGGVGVQARDAVPPAYKIVIHDPVLWVTKVKLLPSVALGHSKKFPIEAASFNMTRVVTRPYSIARGMRSVTLDNVITGQMPKRIVYGFVRSTAYNGAYSRNPFNYEHLSLTQTAVYMNGKSFPLTPFKPVYTGTNVNYMREYASLFDAMGIYHANKGLDISRDEYPNGYCLYGYDVSPNKSAAVSSPINLIKQGTVRIELQFGAELEEAYVCVLFAEFDNLISIDADRNVFVDYSV
jgi:hypothetical protein